MHIPGTHLAAELDRLCSEQWGGPRIDGIVSVSRGEEVPVERAAGLAHRGFHLSGTTETRLTLASGSKGSPR